MAITHRARRIRLERIRKQAKDWNDAHPVGTPVLVKLDFKDEPVTTLTRSPAEVYHEQFVGIFLEGVRGYYHLDHVRAAATPEERAAAAADLKAKIQS